MKQHQTTHRLNLELGPQSYRALTELQIALEAASQAETIRFALQVLAKLVDEVQSGGRIRVEPKRGSGKAPLEIVLPIPNR